MMDAGHGRSSSGLRVVSFLVHQPPYEERRRDRRLASRTHIHHPDDQAISRAGTKDHEEDNVHGI